MQKQMIQEIETAEPRFIVWVQVPTSWLADENSERFIFGWATRYMADVYRPVGCADILPNGTKYVWGADASIYKPTSKYFVTVLTTR